MDDPSFDLIELKKLCKELQGELAFAVPDADRVARLADDVVYIGSLIGQWARGQ